METSPAELLQFHASLIVHKYNSVDDTNAAGAANTAIAEEQQDTTPGLYLDDDDELVMGLWHKIYTTVQRRFAGHAGTVTRIHPNGTYDIEYANGEKESYVSRPHDQPPDHAGHSRSGSGFAVPRLHPLPLLATADGIVVEDLEDAAGDEGTVWHQGGASLSLRPPSCFFGSASSSLLTLLPADLQDWYIESNRWHVTKSDDDDDGQAAASSDASSDASGAIGRGNGYRRGFSGGDGAAAAAETEMETVDDGEHVAGGGTLFFPRAFQHLTRLVEFCCRFNGVLSEKVEAADARDAEESDTDQPSAAVTAADHAAAAFDADAAESLFARSIALCESQHADALREAEALAADQTSGDAKAAAQRAIVDDLLHGGQGRAGGAARDASKRIGGGFAIPVPPPKNSKAGPLEVCRTLFRIERTALRSYGPEPHSCAECSAVP